MKFKNQKRMASLTKSICLTRIFKSHRAILPGLKVNLVDINKWTGTKIKSTSLITFNI